MERAPYFADVADGPADAETHWLTASDGVRIRIGHWAANAKKGTVILFPGRTEYIEKYGRAARDLEQRGYATLAIDWRGQGLSDRLIEDDKSGHVHFFADYQKDVAAMFGAAEALGLPRPFHLLAHSMGGCIGLRSLFDGLSVASCAFSGPMWGIKIAQHMRPIAWSLAWGARRVGLGHAYTPRTSPRNYVLEQPFEGNELTTDPEMYRYMVDQTRAYPELALGGPSLHWLHEALLETRALNRLASPEVPCLTFCGTNERIVDVPRIIGRMARWDGAHLEMIADGEHEVLMEGPETRRRLFDMIATHFGDSSDRETRTRSA